MRGRRPRGIGQRKAIRCDRPTTIGGATTCSQSAARFTLPLFCHQLFDQLGNQRGIILCDKVIDLRLGDLQFLQVADDHFPLLLPFFALGEVEFGHQLLQPLQRDRLAILVVVFDDILLVL